MLDADPREEISRLEAQIEEQSEAIERCRKIILASKLVAAGGAIVIVLLLIGLVRFDAAAMIGAMAAVIGGVVMFGSTTSTSGQLAVAIKDAEARRAELISMINPRVVGSGSAN
jgi:hypothetical protein